MPRVEIGDSYLELLPHGTLEACPFVLAEGPRGTAKTRSILSVMMARLQRWPGSVLIIARSTRTRLTDSVLPTLEKQVFPAFGLSVPGGAGPENRHAYQLSNGSSIILMGLDDPQRGQSVEACWVYVSEVVEIPSMDDVTALAGILRQVVAPASDGSEVKRQLIADCNPGAPGHWVNEIAAESVPASLRRVRGPEDYQRLLAHNAAPPPAGKWKRIISRHQDNPAYWDHDAWDWTPLGRSYLATLGHLSGHLKRRWLDGDWVAAEGVVFPEFDEDRHVIDGFDVPDDWPVAVGYDPGYLHPTAVLWFALAPNRRLYVIDEIYEGGKSVQQHADEIKRRAVGRNVVRYYADPQHAFSRTAQSPRTIAMQLGDCGLRFTPWPRSTDKQAMVEAVRKLLNDDNLRVFRGCKGLIREFQTWSYKRTAHGEIPPGDDAYVDQDNDALDVTCGVVASPFRQYQAGGIRVIG